METATEKSHGLEPLFLGTQKHSQVLTLLLPVIHNLVERRLGYAGVSFRALDFAA